MKLNEEFLTKMHQATRLLRTSGPAAATVAIQRALQGFDHRDMHDNPADDRIVDINPPPVKVKDEGAVGGKTVDPLRIFKDLSGMSRVKSYAARPQQEFDSGASRQHSPAGKFLASSHTNQAGTRAYKLYIPSTYHGEPLPLIVMLHGCKQNPDDFALGTDMNRIAERQGCFVLYPAQAHAANGSNCWNWFVGKDQQRDKGEPSIIADMTRHVMREYRIDSKRIYVAGLSAGGAMAAILAAAYPDLYAAVGIHSGLPVGSAHDVPSAFAAMKGRGKQTRFKACREPVPAIVFHGDYDHTVHPDNGADVLAQCLGISSRNGGGACAEYQVNTTNGVAPDGHAFTQKIYKNDDEAVIAEHWIIHGAGHAWSGGSPAGSYTDPSGPSASQEMIRFFCEHPQKGLVK